MRVCLKLLLAGVALSVAFSCGRPKAEKQDTDKLELPEVPEDGLGLASADLNKTFDGSIVIWDPDAPAAGITAVGEASNELTDVAVENLEYIRSSILPEKNKVFARVADVEELVGAAGRAFYAASYQSGVQWIERHFATVAAMEDIGGLSEAELGATRNLFARYCEAKLWQRATHRLLINDKFMKRPTPSLLCEMFYRGAPQFNSADDQPGVRVAKVFASPECADAVSPEGKDYFPCLWQALLVTKLFDIRYVRNPHPDAQDSAQKLKDLDYETLKTFFGNIRGKHDRMFLKQQQALQIPDGNDVVTVETKFVFEPVRDQRNKPTIWSNASAYELIQLLEKGSDPNYDALRFFPSDGRADEAQRAALLVQSAALRTKLKTFNNYGSQRLMVNESIFNAPLRTTENPRIVLSQAAKEKAQMQFLSIFTATSEEFEAIKIKIAKEQKALSEFGKKLLVLDSNPLTCKGDSENFRTDTPGCRLAEVRARSLEETAVEGTSLAVAPLQLILEKDANSDVLNLKVDFDRSRDSQIVEACIDMETGEALFCQAPENLAIARPVQGCEDAIDQGYVDSCAEFNKEVKTIVVFKKIDDLKKLGLDLSTRENYKDGTTAGFSEMKPAKILGQVLRLEFSLNTVENLLTIAMGGIKIGDYSGSVKALEQETPIQKELRPIQELFERLRRQSQR